MAELDRRIQQAFEQYAGYEDDPEQQDRLWTELRDGVLQERDLAFDAQWELYRRVYGTRKPQAGPPLAWTPPPDVLDDANLTRLMQERGLDTYEELHRWSVEEREAFWQIVVDRLAIPFAQPPERVLDPESDVRDPQWLPGARFNIAESCFQADADKTAIVAGGEGSDEVRRVSYGRLRRMADEFAAGFQQAGLGPGDAVAFYLPMTVECVAAYLGVVLAGGVVVSIPDSFAPDEVATRLRIGQAKAVLTVDAFVRGGKRIELYPKTRKADAPTTVVIPLEKEDPPDLRDGDVLWEGFLGDADTFEPVHGKPDRATNVLFSSGTTGEPKGIPWTQLTPVKAAMDGHFHQDIHPEDVVAWPTNIGWMMGPWLIYATFVNQATMALYDGVPTSDGFVRFVEEAKISVLGLVPSVVRQWREKDATAEVDWSSLRVFSSTGEASNAEDYLWLMSRTGYRAPVIEYCGGTEVGGGHITGTVVQPASPATFTTPALGLDFVVLDADDRSVGEGAEGEIFLIPPSIGLSQRLLNKDHHEVYYYDAPAGPNGAVLRRHGDQVQRLYGGFWQALGRADDTMNLGGIKISSIELERVVDRHPAVSESAAIGVAPPEGGAERLVVYVVLQKEVDTDGLRDELQADVREHLNPLFRIHDVVPVEALPRTASNKVMRRELRAEYGRPDA